MNSTGANKLKFDVDKNKLLFWVSLTICEGEEKEKKCDKFN